MSDIQGAKAISTVVNGGVTELSAGRVFRVRGSEDQSYTVVIAGGHSSCDCAAGLHNRRCYHVRAARPKMANQRAAAA